MKYRTVQKRRDKKFVLHFFVTTQISKTVNLNYVNFEQVQKTENSLPQKIVTKLSKIWVGDLESETHSPNPDPGVKKAPDPGSAKLLLPKKLSLNSQKYGSVIRNPRFG
jgi:hypothetical protein